MTNLSDIPSEDREAGPEVITFGCRLNAYESAVMRNHAHTAGLKDAVIINTCTVTAEAERQARQAIRKARRDHPNHRIIVTGCAAQVNPAVFATMPEVDQVLGNSDKLAVRSFQPDSLNERVKVNDIGTMQETAGHLLGEFDGRVRAFVQVQNGCDHRCTFCIIPHGRGPSRSVPMGAVVEQVQRLVDNGVKEVVLTGVDITSYGPDLPGSPTLGQMARRLLKAVPNLPRLRLSSLDCIEMDPDLLRLIAEEERLMPHLHLSLQAGDDLILKRMKRRHSRQEAVALCKRLRDLRPDMVFGADLIVGFPTETETMFQNTLSLLDDCGLTWLHVFPYSARPGTPAARIPDQVPKPERKERAARLREKGAKQETEFLRSRIGATATVLIERDGRGHTEQFALTQMDKFMETGTLITARMTGQQNGLLHAEAA